MRKMFTLIWWKNDYPYKEERFVVNMVTYSDFFAISILDCYV